MTRQNSEFSVFLITYSLLRLKRQDLFCVKQEAHILYWWATLLSPSWWSRATFLQTDIPVIIRPPHKKAFVNCGWPNCAAAVPLMLSRGDLWYGTVCNLEQDVGKWQSRALRDTLQFHLGVKCPMERLQYDLETTGQVLHPFQYRTSLEASEHRRMLLKKRSWHCYIFGNTKSLLRYISVSVIYYLWQLLFVCPILKYLPNILS